MVSGLEAVADAINRFEGGRPGDKNYQSRNPGNLRNANGDFLEFPSFCAGYAALLRDLTAKFTGNNSHGLGPSSTLLELFEVYAPSSDNNPTLAYAQFVASWASKATGKLITTSTTLQNIFTDTLAGNT